MLFGLVQFGPLGALLASIPKGIGSGSPFPCLCIFFIGSSNTFTFFFSDKIRSIMIPRTRSIPTPPLHQTPLPTPPDPPHRPPPDHQNRNATRSCQLALVTRPPNTYDSRTSRTIRTVLVELPGRTYRIDQGILYGALYIIL